MTRSRTHKWTGVDAWTRLECRDLLGRCTDQCRLECRLSSNGQGLRYQHKKDMSVSLDLTLDDPPVK
jgi:hypothetical protein